MYVQIAEEFSQDLQQIESGEALEEILDRVSGQLGFDHFALSLDANSGVTTGTELLLHDYPEDWARIYVELDLGGRDPVRRACDRSFAGFTWCQMARMVPMTRDDRRMLAIGRESGIGDGYTVPRHLPGRITGSCTFAVQPGKRLPERALHVTERIGALALDCALKFTRMAVVNAFPRLSDRQRECLLWVARGKTAAETAIILGISSQTVTQHLKMARERYEVHCCQSLILSALFDGLIGFGDVFSPSELESFGQTGDRL